MVNLLANPPSLLPPLAPEQRRMAFLFPHPLMWAMLPVFAAIAAVWLALSPMELAITPALTNMLTTIAVLGGLALAALLAGLARTAVFLFSLAFFFAFGILGRVLNYLAMSTGMPFVDAWLARIDALLGFDWHAYVAWMNANPQLAALAAWAYKFHGWLFFSAFVWLAATGRFVRLRGLLMLFAFCGLVAMAGGALFPALAGYGHYQPPPSLYANMDVSYASDFPALLRQLNSGAFSRIVLEEAVGLVTIPSYHTIMALMFMWAFRGTLLQWPVWGISVLILLATPVYGGHYLVDILAGAATFALVLAMLKRAGLLEETPPEKKAARALAGV